ncbi:tellurite resistance TerB family protein [Roseateles oligotrophus]|uniref:TerB family tellurite resistance protein n=1 Tax=Roseateles oligotrophus TaxID=1769250 RepID=A0ABT2YB11_9BURK|nr:TerB family tellurite resistance protein [Roseateles oligotrophus]MCV2367497.1 TerB family tellurite resistance protein [Roseateles oligotrophus]
MRHYPVNSPQAAARIVALTVVADGDIAEAEIECLDRLAVHEQLGLTRHELLALLDTFCEDLLSSGQLNWADTCPVDERTLADLMGEIQDPALRLKVLRICVELAEVDAQVDDGESNVLIAAVEHWGLHHEMFRSSTRN